MQLNRILRMADAATAAGAGAGKTVETGKSPLETAIAKVFPEESEPAAAAAPDKPETPKPGEKPPGETDDLSPTEKADSEKQKAAAPEEDAAALAERAKARGVTPEQQKADEATEQSRLEAIAAKTGETFEQIYEREEKDGKPTELEAGKPAKTFSQEEVEATVQKRVKNLAAENERLKAELAAKPAATTGGPLEGVTDEAKLGEVAVSARKGIREADGLLDDLRYDEDGVREKLTKYLGDAAAETDLSVKGMAKILRQLKDGFNTTLEAVPQRKAWLEARAKAEPIAKAVHPWLAEPEDERTVLFQQTVQMMPSLKQNPAWDYWLGHAIQGHLNQVKAAKAAEAARANPGASPNVKLRLKSALPGTGRPGGSAPKKGTFAQAKAKGNVAEMAEALGL